MLFLVGVNTYFLAVFSEAFKGHHTVNLGKKGIIFSKPHILPWMNMGTLLSYKDAAGRHFLASKSFHSISFAGTIAPVARTSACLFMSHFFLLLPIHYDYDVIPYDCFIDARYSVLGLDFFDFDQTNILPMSLFSLVVLSSLVLEDY